jgi:hypothetical protein
VYLAGGPRNELDSRQAEDGISCFPGIMKMQVRKDSGAADENPEKENVVL